MGRVKSRIKRVSDSTSTRLTKESLLLLLDEMKTQIHPKILKLTREGRQKRRSFDPSGEDYSKMVRENNEKIMKCIRATLEQVMKDVQVLPSEFEQSVEFYQEEVVQMKLFELRKVHTPNPPQLSKENVERILDYFIKVLKGIDEVSQIELLDLEIMFTQCEDKVFQKFGVEKADVETQAMEMAQKDKAVAHKLKVYRLQVRQKEALFQGNNNLSHFHAG